MSPADWIALVTVGGTTLGIGIRLIMGTTRLIDAVERLTCSVEKIAGKVEDHEQRLIRGGL